MTMPPLAPVRRRCLTVLGCSAALLALPGRALALSRGQPRRQPPDMVVIHSTGGPTCDPQGRPIWVGAGEMAENMRHIEAHPSLGIHHMIDRDGTLRSSVPEDEVAHHIFRHSGRSIAIELINDGDGRDPFPEAQLAALVTLLRGIRERHGIGRPGVHRHSDLDRGRMACDRSRPRKVDPGAAFPFDAVLDRAYGPR